MESRFLTNDPHSNTERRSRASLRHVKTARQANSRGFTLLLAALVVSIVLALGAAIFGIAQKQLTLSGLGRDSQFAFYAADTAAECALYWDFRYEYFATSTPTNLPAPDDPKCDGQLMNVAVVPGEGDPENPPYYPYVKQSAPMDFFKDGPPASLGFCAEVFVKKCKGTFSANGVCNFDPETDIIRTLIHANGYSTNCNSIATSPRALQRSVELHY